MRLDVETHSHLLMCAQSSPLNALTLPLDRECFHPTRCTIADNSQLVALDSDGSQDLGHEE